MMDGIWGTNQGKRSLSRHVLNWIRIIGIECNFIASRLGLDGLEFNPLLENNFKTQNKTVNVFNHATQPSQAQYNEYKLLLLQPGPNNENVAADAESGGVVKAIKAIVIGDG